MAFEAGMCCPNCATPDKQFILVENAEDRDVLQCTNPFCLMLYINLPDEQIAVPEKPSGVMH